MRIDVVPEILDVVGRRGMPDPGDLRLLHRRADPAEPLDIEPHVGAIGRNQLQPLLERNVAGRHADHRAVALGDVVQMIGHDQGRCAGHVANDDAGIARDVAADVAGHGPSREVVAAADRAADQHLDGLAAIEVRHRFGLRAAGHDTRAAAPMSAWSDRRKRFAMSGCQDHGDLASDASSRPWPRIASVRPIALNAMKKHACV